MILGIGILAIILVMLSIIGDVVWGLRNYMIVIRGDLAPRKVCFEGTCPSLSKSNTLDRVWQSAILRGENYGKHFISFHRFISTSAGKRQSSSKRVFLLTGSVRSLFWTNIHKVWRSNKVHKLLLFSHCHLVPSETRKAHDTTRRRAWLCGALLWLFAFTQIPMQSVQKYSK